MIGNNQPEFGKADLTNCDREPLHLPGSIQPHGVLLSISESDLTILQVSSNAGSVLGIEANYLLRKNVEVLLGREQAASLRTWCLPNPQLKHANPFPIRLNLPGTRDRIFSGILHRSATRLILELEVTDSDSFPSSIAVYQNFRNVFEQLTSSRTLDAQFAQTATAVRVITGFDRVMIYKFDEAGHGQVISESKSADLPSYLGLNFHSSDIPKQARELYTRNWIRTIPDVGYVPVPLVPRQDPETHLELDLSFAQLRSVSPMHLRYLDNINVRASMSISLLRDGELWGLIACHNEQPRFVPFEIRSACEMLGQVLSSQLSTRVASENNARAVKAKTAGAGLTEALSRNSDLMQGLLEQEEALFELVQADGLIVSLQGELRRLRFTPDEEACHTLLAWLTKNHPDSLFSTHCLSQEYEQAIDLKDCASGILALPIAASEGSYLIWCRRECVQVVDWAGAPGKALLFEHADRLTPHGSFALWKETVKLRSMPWHASDIDAVQEFRNSLLGVVVNKASQLNTLNRDLMSAISSRDSFLSVASHELKTPLTTLQLQLQNLLKGASRGHEWFSAERVVPRLGAALRQVSRLEKLIDGLLDVSRIATGNLTLDFSHRVNYSQILRETVAPYQEELSRLRMSLVLDIEEDVIGFWDPIRLHQICDKLISNAVKFGNLKPICVVLKSSESVARLEVRDSGCGIAPEAQRRIFERFERGVIEHNYSGLGLGLWIVRELTEAMGGKITVESEVGSGSVFVVELPRKNEAGNSEADR